MAFNLMLIINLIIIISYSSLSTYFMHGCRTILGQILVAISSDINEMIESCRTFWDLFYAILVGDRFIIPIQSHYYHILIITS